MLSSWMPAVAVPISFYPIWPRSGCLAIMIIGVTVIAPISSPRPRSRCLATGCEPCTMCFAPASRSRTQLQASSNNWYFICGNQPQRIQSSFCSRKRASLSSCCLPCLLAVEVFLGRNGRSLAADAEVAQDKWLSCGFAGRHQFDSVQSSQESDLSGDSF